MRRRADRQRAGVVRRAGVHVLPYTAPSTALLRNGLGTLSGWEAAIVVVELFVLGVLALRLAVRLFRYGSIEYSNRLPVGTVLRRRR